MGHAQEYSLDGLDVEPTQTVRSDRIGNGAMSGPIAEAYDNMAEVSVLAEGHIAAPARFVYELLSNFREHHPRFLPDNFKDLEIEQGGVGAGTIITFTASALGNTRRYRMRIGEPEPGRVMTESDTLSDMVTTWTVIPEGESSRVRIETRWAGADGVSGFFERLLVPPAMRRIYNDELRRLDRYAQEQASRQVAVGAQR